MTALLSSSTAAQPTSVRPLPPPTGPAHATLRLPLWARSLIVAALDVGEATSKTHVSHVLAELGVRDRVQAVIYAFEVGFAPSKRAMNGRIRSLCQAKRLIGRGGDPGSDQVRAAYADATVDKNKSGGEHVPLQDSESAPPSRRPVHRATGASLVAVICVAVTFCGIMVMHAVRSDVDPLHDVMSHYANGSRGVVMSVVFYAFGACALALGFRLRTAIDHPGITRGFPVLLALAGLSLIVAGVFEVDRPLAPQTIQEVLHSNSAVGAFVMLVVAMLLFSLACRGDDRWWSVRWISMGLAATATAAAVATQLAGDSGYSGAVQRVLAGAVLGWFVLTATHVRRRSFGAS